MVDIISIIISNFKKSGLAIKMAWNQFIGVHNGL